MKRPALATAAAVWIAAAWAGGAALAAAPEGDASWNRFEIRVLGGYGRTPAAGASSFSRTSSSTYYAHIAASDAFTFDPSSAASAGAWCTYLLTPSLGIEAGFGYLRSTARGRADFRLEYFRDAAATVRAAWTGQGQMTAVPLCLNLAARLAVGGVAFRASAGVSLFLNSYLAGMTGGVEAVQAVYTSSGGDPSAPILADEKLDGLAVPLTTPDTTWTALGANAGAALDVRIGRTAALSFEARYFHGPSKEIAWSWAPGVYAGIGGAVASWNFTADAADAAGRATTRLSVDPSFFSVSAGLRFSFPGPPAR